MPVKPPVQGLYPLVGARKYRNSYSHIPVTNGTRSSRHALNSVLKVAIACGPRKNSKSDCETVDNRTDEVVLRRKCGWDGGERGVRVGRRQEPQARGMKAGIGHARCITLYK